MTRSHKNISVNKENEKQMKKLKIFESKDNMTYSEIAKRIEGLTSNTGYDHVKTEISSGKPYNGINKDIKILLITDKDELLKLGYDTSYTNRAVNTNNLIPFLDSKDVISHVMCYYNDYKSFYSLQNDRIRNFIEKSTKLTEEQKSDLNQKVSDRLTDLMGKTTTIMERNIDLIKIEGDPIENGYR